MNTNRTKWLLTIAMLTGVLAMTVPVAPALAQEGDDQAMRDLQEAFKRRFRDVEALKADGVVGETFRGYLDAVDGGKAGGDAEKLIDEENRDRRKLYALIAEKEKTSPEKVAERNAARNFQKARSGEYLKGPDGTWKRKT